MQFKINISEKSGKTYKTETESKALLEKKLNDKIKGSDISPDLEGYEFQITGASDKSGFTSMEGVKGIGLKKVLLTYGKGMKKKPRREGKKKLSNPTPKGLRLRKTVRGEIISEATTQINLKILKQGEKPLNEIFPEQNKKEEKEPTETPAKEQQSTEETAIPEKEQQSTEEQKQEVKEIEETPAKEQQSTEETAIPEKEQQSTEEQKQEAKETEETAIPEKEPEGQIPKEGIEEAKK